MDTTAARGRRLRLDLATIGLPEVSCVGIYDMTKAERYAAEERHTRELELVLVKRGDFAFAVDGEEYHVRAGEMLVIFPGETHGGGGRVLGRCVHYWFKFRLDHPGRPFLGLAAPDATLLIDSLRNLPARQFKVLRRVDALFEEIAQLVDTAGGELARIAIASRIVMWLTLVVQCAHSPAASGHTPEVERAVQWIREHPDEAFDVDAFAEEACTSTSVFRRRFRQEVGVPVHSFHLEAKVEQACRLLADTPRSVTDIAYALGFSSSQYFSTVFKRHTTLTPLEYRRTLQPNTPADDAGSIMGRPDP